MRILILGLNYAPEPVGIGPYTAGMAEFLAAAGHEVTVVAGKPYYPQWRKDPAFAGAAYRRSIEHGVTVVRCPLYVPADPTGARRLLHHASFAAAAAPAMHRALRSARPDIVMSIAPSLIASPVARRAARSVGAAYWLHIQDFEVEAALATGLLKPASRLARGAAAFERSCLDADRVSTISPQMCARLADKGVPAERIVELRNWADLDSVRPLQRPSEYRSKWQIETEHVALYSGNIANKQGIGIVLAAARLLRSRKDLTFVICGEGPNRARLESAAGGLGNIRFHDLQPRERLSELLGLASVHLLPQIAGAADLVLPSKLTNMLASGRAVVATAEFDTGLAAEVDGCGILTRPGNAAAFAGAIETLLDRPRLREALANSARARAERRWSKNAILSRFEAELDTVASARPQPLAGEPARAAPRATAGSGCAGQPRPSARPAGRP